MLVVRVEKRLDVLGVERLGALGEAHEVAEDDADDLSLPARHIPHGAKEYDVPAE